MVGKPVVLVNRTSTRRWFQYDGMTFPLEPGRNHGYTTVHVPFAKGQNPLNGTEHYLSRTYESLIGVEGTKDPIDPIPDEIIEAAKDAERFDSNTMPMLRRNRQMIASRHVVPADEARTAATADAFAAGG